MLQICILLDWILRLAIIIQGCSSFTLKLQNAASYHNVIWNVDHLRSILMYNNDSIIQATLKLSLGFSKENGKLIQKQKFEDLCYYKISQFYLQVHFPWAMYPSTIYPTVINLNSSEINATCIGSLNATLGIILTAAWYPQKQSVLILPS